MIFKKFKKEHQYILKNWLQDQATRKHLGGILPLDNFIHYITTTPATEHVSFLVFEEKEPIGMVDIEFTPNEQTASMSLLVNPDSRNKGVGKFILGATVQLSCLQNCTRLDAFIDPDNIPSLTCFQKSGFQKMSDLPDEDGMFCFSYFFDARP